MNSSGDSNSRPGCNFLKSSTWTFCWTAWAICSHKYSYCNWTIAASNSFGDVVGLGSGSERGKDSYSGISIVASLGK